MTAELSPPLIAILGPTASGKSPLAIHLAHQLNGEVIACDSTQLYRGFDIGTGKPTATERQGIPHHLLDVLHPNEAATAGGYREMALEVLGNLRQRKKLPILTIGTGLYMRALFEGLANLPQRSQELRNRLRTNAEKHSPNYLHRLLKRLDPHSASRIAPADTQKLLRAVEVCLLTRKPLTQVHSEGRTPLEGWQITKIGLEPPREQLYERIHARIDQMLAAGWQTEVATLIAATAAENDPGTAKATTAALPVAGQAKPFDFLGYRELAAVSRHQLSLGEARSAIQQSTRRYAKRQQTWFRHEPNVKWFAGFGDQANLQSEIYEWLLIVHSPTAYNSSDTRSRHDA
jgi:tRNA dimethylallyltransferase